MLLTAARNRIFDVLRAVAEFPHVESTARTKARWVLSENVFGGGRSGPRGVRGGRSAHYRYHFGRRFYDPNLARWTQADPIDQAADLQQANRYAYVGGSPVNSVDTAGAFSIGIDIEAEVGPVRVSVGAAVDDSGGVGVSAGVGGWSRCWWWYEGYRQPDGQGGERERDRGRRPRVA
jgi:RHS repeat-associated protein